MSHWVFLAEFTEVRITEVLKTETHIVLIGQSTVKEQTCPQCGVNSRRIHSYYQRCPQDLPCQGLQVRLQLRVKRFRCTNPNCCYSTFAERLPTLVSWHQQRTVRLDQLLETLAFEMGGEAGVRCLSALALQVSADTLLRRMRKTVPPPPTSPTIIGVDDWAYRRGDNYGTLIVDLDRQQPIDVLPDRQPETLASWLRQHPHIQLVSRDRSKTYAEGIRQGAPQALQVADRWHLLKNLREALNQTLLPFTKQLRTIPLEITIYRVGSISQPPLEAIQPHQSARALRPVEQLRYERRQHWETLFQQVHELAQQGWTVSAIARHLHLDRKTVRKYQRFDHLPPKTCTRLGPRLLDPFRDYIQKRLLEENPSGRQVFLELQAQGYSGCKTGVMDCVTQIRQVHGLPKHTRRQEVSGSTPAPKILTAPTLATIVIMDERQRSPEQQRWIKAACALEPRIEQAISLTQAFAQALRTRQPEFLDTWLEQTSHSHLSGLKSFAVSLKTDEDAVRAAFSSPYSNGQLEGQITRLKLLKRQMYGRAKFDLLRLRVLRP
jgi:transposase